MKRLLVCAVLLLGGGLCAAEEPPRADAVTEPGRTFSRALDVVLASADGKRNVVFVLDAGPTLAQAGFADAFAQALARNARALTDTTFTVLVAGKNDKPRIHKSGDRTAVAQAVTGALAKPAKSYVNVWDAVRRGAGLAGGKGGAVVVVSMDNHDLEDDLEGAVKALRRKKVPLHAITREAFLADTYWLSYGTTAKPRRPLTRAIGGDAAFPQIPWGWIFQTSMEHAAAGSGFAPYTFGRVASATGGRVFLQSEPSGPHVCYAYGSSCLFCDTRSDHAPATQSYQRHRVHHVAPLVDKRTRVLKTLAKDGYYRLVLKTWAQASKIGLLRSRPSVKLAGGTLKPEKRVFGSQAQVLGLDLKRMRTKSLQLATQCQALVDEHAAAFAALGDDAGSPRCRAIADYVLAMLRLTHFNLRLAAAWCDGPGPWMVRKAQRELVPPEVAPYGAERKLSSVSLDRYALCHGVAPFRHVRFAQTAQMGDELAALDRHLGGYFRRWAHTPFEIAMRRATLPRFRLIYLGTGKTTTPTRRGSDADADVTDAPRPSRPGGGGGSSSGGATTGGG